jgi:CDP-4-dehydro-6-deoxyglucose reductase
MTTPSHIISCTKKEIIAPGVYELKFTKPDGFMFKAGQFILFDVPLMENPVDVQTRALSIASTSKEKELLFAVKMKPGGRMSDWVEHVLEVGTEVRMQGPLGLFLMKEDDSARIFIATGAGIAPFRSQLKWALEEQTEKIPMHLLFGVREQADFFWLEDFELLANTFPYFKFHPVLSGEDESWTGFRGRVQTHIPRLNVAHPGAGFYICGAPDMVKDVKESCLMDLEIPKAKVHAEGYI